MVVSVPITNTNSNSIRLNPVARVSIWQLLKATRRFCPKKPWVISSEFEPNGCCKIIHVHGRITEQIFIYLAMVVYLLFFVFAVQRPMAALFGFLVISNAGILLLLLSQRILMLRVEEDGVVSFSRCGFLCSSGAEATHPTFNITDIRSVKLCSEGRMCFKALTHLDVQIEMDLDAIFTDPLTNFYTTHIGLCADSEILLFAIHMYLRGTGSQFLGQQTQYFLTPRHSKQSTSIFRRNSVKICGSASWRMYFNFVFQYIFFGFMLSVIVILILIIGAAFADKGIRQINWWTDLDFYFITVGALAFVFCNLVPVGRTVSFVDENYFVFATRYLLFKWSQTVSSSSLQGVCFCEEVVEKPYVFARHMDCVTAPTQVRTWVFFLYDRSYDLVILQDNRVEELKDVMKEVCSKIENQTIRELSYMVDECSGGGMGHDVAREIVSFLEAPKQEDVLPVLRDVDML